MATATVVGLAVSGGDDEQQVTPAGLGSGEPSPDTVTSTAVEETPATETASAETPPAETPPASETQLPAPTYGPNGQKSCDRAVAEYVDNATMSASVPYGDGFHTYLYVNRGQWVVCDTWASIDDDTPTVTRVQPFTPGGIQLSKELFAISMNYSMNDGDGAQYFAAGAHLDGVRSISYAFPTGDTVDATITDDMWVMQYLMQNPPRRMWTEPVVVTVTLDSGATQKYELRELDLCAQINHGC